MPVSVIIPVIGGKDIGDIRTVKFPWRIVIRGAILIFFVKQSPLFNADKMHTPLLFLHGDADVNVPVGESIQMFTALKFTGARNGFCGCNGTRSSYSGLWQEDSVAEHDFAWFAKWLQDDATWWNAIYKPKAL